MNICFKKILFVVTFILNAITSEGSVDHTRNLEKLHKTTASYLANQFVSKRGFIFSVYSLYDQTIQLFTLGNEAVRSEIRNQFEFPEKKINDDLLCFNFKSLIDFNSLADPKVGHVVRYRSMLYVDPSLVLKSDLKFNCYNSFKFQSFANQENVQQVINKDFETFKVIKYSLLESPLSTKTNFFLLNSIYVSSTFFHSYWSYTDSETKFINVNGQEEKGVEWIYTDNVIRRVKTLSNGQSVIVYKSNYDLKAAMIYIQLETNEKESNYYSTGDGRRDLMNLFDYIGDLDKFLKEIFADPESSNSRDCLILPKLNNLNRFDSSDIRKTEFPSLKDQDSIINLYTNPTTLPGLYMADKLPDTYFTGDGRKCQTSHRLGSPFAFMFVVRNPRIPIVSGSFYSTIESTLK